MGAAKVVGALLFEGFELLDVFGPLEAWGILGAKGGWRVVTYEWHRDEGWDPFAKIHGLVG